MSMACSTLVSLVNHLFHLSSLINVHQSLYLVHFSSISPCRLLYAFSCIQRMCYPACLFEPVIYIRKTV